MSILGEFQEKAKAEMKADPDFMAWLIEYDPSWEAEYIGTLCALSEAFKAGRDAERKEDHINSDHE